MTFSSRIKKIREFLELNQEEFAIVLGVTKLTIIRYEAEYNLKPVATIRQKFLLLHNALNKKEDTKFINEIFKSNNRLIAIGILSSILHIGSLSFPSDKSIEINKYGVINAINNPIGKSLFEYMKTMYNENQ